MDNNMQKENFVETIQEGCFPEDIVSSAEALAG